MTLTHADFLVSRQDDPQDNDEGKKTQRKKGRNLALLHLFLSLWFVVFLSACAIEKADSLPFPTPIPLLPTPLLPTPGPATSTAPPSSSPGAVIGGSTFGMSGGGDNTVTTSEQIDLYAVDAPEFPPDLAWLNTEKPLSLAQLRGKIVLLDFWTYGCVNCLHNFPYLKQLEAAFPDELVIIGVHSAKFDNESQTKNIRQVILRYGLEHAVVNDSELQVWNGWNVHAWPTLVLVDPVGTIAGLHIGEGFYGPFNSLIRQLITSFEARGLLDRTPLRRKLESEGLPATVLSFPGKVLADGVGERLFIADTNHNRIVVADRLSGEVLAVIGNGTPGLDDGAANSATFAAPQGMALSAEGRILYVADTGNHAVRSIDLATGDVRTIAGTGKQAQYLLPASGSALTADISSPWDLALDRDNLYIAMAGSHQITLLNLSTGQIEPAAGSGVEGWVNGPAAQAELAQPSGLALGSDSRLYFADSESSAIRWLDLTDDTVGLLAGGSWNLFKYGDVDGSGENARFQHPLGVTLADGQLYVADTYNSKLKRIDPLTGETVTLFGGESGWRDGADPLFYEPGGISATDGKLYVADTNNHSIRVVDLSSGETNTLVLKGIQRFLPDADADNFFGQVLQLDPIRVGAGSGEVVLDVRLPEGYKVNDQAPYSMAWGVTGDVAVLEPNANRSIVAPQFPLHLAATFQPGQGTLTGDLTIIYCEAEKATLCLLDQVRLEVPLTVSGDGPSAAILTYPMTQPEIRQ